MLASLRPEGNERPLVAVVGINVAVVLAWAWMTAVSLKTYRLHGDACAPDDALTPS